MAFWLGNFQKIISSIFFPGSKVELFLRTLYHKVRATSLFTNYSIKKSLKSYKAWLNAQNQWLKNQDAPTGNTSILTFILPVSDLELATWTIYSIQNQRCKQWRILLSIPNLNENNETIQDFDKNPRINLINGSDENLSAWISECQTDYFVLCRQGDIFSEYFVESFAIANNKKSNNYSVYYYDVETQSSEFGAVLPMFKPSTYSPELHLSTNYLSRSVISTHFAKTVLPNIDSSVTLDIQEWELLLLLGRDTEKIHHIPFVLLNLSNHVSFHRQAYCKLIQRHLSRQQLQVVVGMYDKNDGIKWQSGQPLISIIIPTKNNFQKLNTLLESLFTLTDYPAYEIIIVDSGSTDQRLEKYYEGIKSEKPIRVLKYDQPFNYSKVNNLGAGHAKGELLLFLNDDMQVLKKDWLSELSQWALREEIGVVGTKLIHPNGKIQHVGIVIGMQGFIGHLYRNAPDHYHGLAGSTDWYRNVSAVTGACQMIRKKLFWDLGGYDERYELVVGDIDLCLKAIKHGYRNLYTPHAALLHHEGASRGYQTPVEDILRGYEEMDEILKNGDPFFSPNLTLEPIPRCKMNSWLKDDQPPQYLERKNYYLLHYSKKNREK